MARVIVPEAEEGGFGARPQVFPHPSPLPQAGEAGARLKVEDDITHSDARHPPLRHRPRRVRRRARRRLSRMGFRRHSRPRHCAVADRPRVRRVRALLRVAGRREDAISPQGHRRCARLHAVRHRDGEGFALSGSQGVLAHRPRNPARFEVRRRDGAERVAERDSGIPRGRLRAVRSARHARHARAACARAAHRSSRNATSTTRRISAIRSCARSTIRRSRRPTFRTCAPARTRTSTSSRCWSARARKGSK